MRRAAVILALVGAGAVSAVTLIGAVAASAVAAQPRHPVYLIYDGFVRNADGSLTLAFGYYNVNHVEVTVAGEDNVFLPGASDPNPSLPRLAVVLRIWVVFGECGACNLLIIKDRVLLEMNVVP